MLTLFHTRQKRTWFSACFITLTNFLCSPAHAFIIDGNFNDWGLQRTNSASDWAPNSTVRKWVIEDQTGSTGTYLNPGWGGQRYDAEALYISWDSSNVYIALVTGLPPNNPQNPAGNSYGPGDFLFDFGSNGSTEFGLVTTNSAGKSPGGFYAVSAVNYGLWSSPGVLAGSGNPAIYPVSVAAGNLLTNASLVYSSTTFNNMGIYASDQHYFAEAAIPISAFGSHWTSGGPTEKFSLQWAALCANDLVTLNVPVPSPSTLVLMFILLCSLFMLRQRVN